MMSTMQNVPKPTYQRLIGREADVREIMARLSSAEERAWIVPIEGVAGLGKTALAQEVAWGFIKEYAHLSPAGRFDVIIWVTARPESAADGQSDTDTFTTLDDLYRAVATALEVPTLLQVASDERMKVCWAALHRQERVLLVVDNLEADEDDLIPRFLRDLPRSTKALVTTRFHENLPYPLRLRPLELPAARELVTVECSARGLAPTPDQIDTLAQGIQGMPLAARLVAGLCASEGIDAVSRSLGDLKARVSASLLTHSVTHLRHQHADSYQCLLACGFFDSVAGATGEALAACMNLDPAAAGRARARLEYLNLVQPLHEHPVLAKPAQALREHDTVVRYTMLPLIHEYARREGEQHRQWQQHARRTWVDYYRHVTSPLADPAHYASAEADAPNLIAVLRWLNDSGQVDELAAFFGATQEFLYAQHYWHELIEFATRILESLERSGRAEQTTLSAQTLTALLQSPIDIFRRRGQLESAGMAWVTRVAALSHHLRDHVLDAELDLARRRLLCNDGTLAITTQVLTMAKLPPDEIRHYLKLTDPEFVDDVELALRTFKRAGRGDKAFQALATLGNFYRVRAQDRRDFDRASERYTQALAVLKEDTLRSPAWRETRAAVVRASQALVAGRLGRFDESCDGLAHERVALVDAVDRVEADVARAYYEYRRGNRDKAFALRTEAIGGKAKLGLREVWLCLEDRLWDEEGLETAQV